MLNPFKPFELTTLPASALSDASAALARLLIELFNAYFKEKKFPSELKLANVIPLYTKGEIDNPTNYRSIFITPVLLKIFEKFCKAQMKDHLNAKKLLIKRQFAFRRNIFTIDALVYFTECVR